ncbi:hypothetical protein DXG01_007298 [Tephrocybe rancida]|nr:hypothetical protein DXG01_007298 [Tephrocybe rancida]
MSADYVIVGAGVTGIALAARLSEDPSTNVTVLEAGTAPFHDEQIDAPGYILHQLGNPSKDWAFFSTPQKHLGDRPVFLPRQRHWRLESAKSHAIQPVEFPLQSTIILGLTGTGVDAELAMLNTTSEGLKYDEEYAAKYGCKFDPEYHGTAGPLQTRIPTYFNPATLPWLKTLKGLGIKHNPDPSTGDITGSFISVSTVDDKSIRSSAASAYYEPNQSRPNLKVISGALATKVLTSGSDSVVIATGVEYLKDGVLQTIHATKEVILSAGSYKTPQVLELSGVGDPKVLKKLGIDVIVDLPGVGNNLQVVQALNVDHFMIPLTMKVKKDLDLETFARMDDPAFAKKQTEQFLTKLSSHSKANGTGLLAGTPAAYAFLTLKDFDKDGKLAALADKLVLPDTPMYRLQKEWVKNDRVPFLEITGYDRFMPGLAVPEPGAEYLSGSFMCLHPFNLGSVHISSTDPNAAPLIDHNYLDNEFDTQLLVAGFKLTREIFNSAPLKDLIEEEVSPGPNYQTDGEITEFIKKVLGTVWHPVGTASLLPRQDGGVVDTQFKVHGTQNLRVADASVIPIQLGAHPQATLYAFAEKVLFLILLHSLTAYRSSTFAQLADIIKAGAAQN